MSWTKTTTVFPRDGWTIEQSIEYAIDTAKRRRTTVEFKINNIWMSVVPESKVSTVKNAYLKLLNAKQYGG